MSTPDEVPADFAAGTPLEGRYGDVLRLWNTTELSAPQLADELGHPGGDAAEVRRSLRRLRDAGYPVVRRAGTGESRLRMHELAIEQLSGGKDEETVLQDLGISLKQLRGIQRDQAILERWNETHLTGQEIAEELELPRGSVYVEEALRRLRKTGHHVAPRRGPASAQRRRQQHQRVVESIAEGTTREDTARALGLSSARVDAIVRDQEILECWNDTDDTAGEISAALGYDNPRTVLTVIDRLRDEGHTVRPRRPRARGPEAQEEDLERLRQLRAQGASKTQIARELECSKAYVDTLLERAGETARVPAPSAAVIAQRDARLIELYKDGKPLDVIAAELTPPLSGAPAVSNRINLLRRRGHEIPRRVRAAGTSS